MSLRDKALEARALRNCMWEPLRRREPQVTRIEGGAILTTELNEDIALTDRELRKLYQLIRFLNEEEAWRLGEDEEE